MPAVAALTASCAQTRTNDLPGLLNRVSDAYLRLALAVGVHDADYVDAYYGPPALKEEAAREKLPLTGIESRAEARVAELLRARPLASDQMLWLRHHYLARQLESMIARVRMLRGVKLKFDEESAALYDAVAPRFSDRQFQTTLDALDHLLPGAGPLAGRYRDFQQQFEVSKERLSAVFQAAIDEARRRTRSHIRLPADEAFRVEYVTGQVWSAYNWYQGRHVSLIQVNTDFPVDIDRVILLACHEGYPGHHVYNVLLEQRLVEGRGWREFTVYPLYSPQSLIAEGTANYGVALTLPDKERVEFKKKVLFPLAGLDPKFAAKHEQVRLLVEKLSYADSVAARRYLDGEANRDQTGRWLEKFALLTPERARQRLAFIDKNRSYVINYSLGQDLIRQYMDRHGATAANPDKQWREFEALLASPCLASTLQ